MINNQQHLKTKISEANTLLANNDIEGVGKLLREIDFMLGKYDDYINLLTETFTAMTDFDFSKRLPVYDDEDGLFANLMSRGINWMNEEFEAVALHKNVVNTVFDAIQVPNAMLIVTDTYGTIKVVNRGTTELPNFNEEALSGQSINVIFEDFDAIIDRRLKEGNSTKNIPINLKWRGLSVPTLLNIGLSSRGGKLDAGIYFIKLTANWKDQVTK